MENKKIKINVVTCNLKNITEDVLQSYDDIVINSVVVVSSPKAQELINRYGNVTLNAVQSCVTDENVQVNTVNGVSEIGPGDIPTEKVILIVNGSLIIKTCPPELFDNYVSIYVNGKVMCPKSLSAVILSKASVNGKLSFYTDGAVFLKNKTNIDRIFVLRAKEATYWAEKLLFLDTTLDTDALRAKGARFEAKKVVIAESIVEKIIDLISEESDIKVVPDGTQFINDDAKLSKDLINRYGTKLYVNGDLDVKEEAAEVLSELEYVFVSGNVNICKEYVEQFCSIKPEYDEMNVINRRYDKVLEDKVSVKIDKAILEKCPNGIHVCGCARLEIAENVPTDLIVERLVITDCAVINCFPEQESAVSFVDEDCAIISAKGDEEDDEREEKEPFNTRIINAVEYKF